MAFADLNPGAEPYDGVRILCAWAEQPLVERLPGARARPKDPDAPLGFQAWVAPLSWGTCVTMRGLLGTQLVLGDALAAWAWDERARRVDQARSLRELTEWPAEWPRCEGLPESDERLYPFQQVGSWFVGVAGDCIIGDDMGLGKTVQVMSTLLSLRPDDFPVLVVSPNSVKRHWERLAGRWLPQAVPYVVSGGAVQRRKILGRAKDDPRALIMVNYEAVRLLSRLDRYGSIALKRCAECDPRYGDETLSVTRCEVHQKELNDFGLRTVVYDEIHHLGDPQSKQTRACWAVGHDPSVRQRWGMTGTLFDRPEAVWALFHAVAPLDFPTRTAFMDRYMLTGWNSRGGLQVVGFNPETKHELFEFLDPRYRRMPQALVLPQLPPKIREVRTAPMGREQARMYRDLDERHVTRTEDGQVWVVPHELVVRTRLLQLASSQVDLEKPDEDDPKTWKVTCREPAPKLDVMMEVVEELGQRQFAVAAPWRQLVDLAHARLVDRGITCGLIHGGISEVDRQRALDDLDAGRIQALLFVMKAGGEGLPMQAAGTLIRIQRPDSLLQNLQTEKRVHRIGSERHDVVLIVDIVTEDTLEVEQVERLNGKLEQLEELNRDKAKLLAAGFDERSNEVQALEQVAASITAVDDVWGKIDVSRQIRAWQEEDERRSA